MPRVNIYLPDGLADRARQAQLNVSALAQEAISGALDARATDAWLDDVRTRARSQVAHGAVIDALDASRDEDERRHG